MIVPCIFMIGENGVPLEVSAGYISPSELAQKFNKALQASTNSYAVDINYCAQPLLVMLLKTG